MAYDATKHKAFSQQMSQWFRSVQQLREESRRLDEIYVNEALSGADPAFTDTAIATEQEHIDGIVFMRAFKAMIENGAVSTGDRTGNITAFLM